MARPARVRIRRRKPCVFARLRLFGWNVRFTGTAPSRRSRWKAGRGPVQRRHRSTDGTGLRKQASTRPVGQCTVVTPPQRTVAAGPATMSRPAARDLLSRTFSEPGRIVRTEPSHWALKERLDGAPPWGQRWGRAVDERGTTRSTPIDRPHLGTTRTAVPSRILTATRPLSRADRCSSTCPQGLWLLQDFSLLTSIQTNSLGTGSAAWAPCPLTRSQVPQAEVLPKLSTA